MWEKKVKIFSYDLDFASLYPKYFGILVKNIVRKKRIKKLLE